MVKSISIKELIEEMDMQMDESETLYHKPSGKLYTFAEEEIRAAEDEEPLDRFPDWQKDNIQDAIHFIEHEDLYIPIPSKFDIHEWEIMLRFSLSLDDKKLSDRLYDRIHGRGAFRRFKDAIMEYDVEDQWFNYREKAFRKIAVEWCEDHEIPYEDDVGGL